MQPIQALGMAWFYEDDYEAFRSVLPDRSWHRTFHEWEAAAEKGMQRIRDQGGRPVKAKARSTEFIAWCAAAGHHVDAKALTAFAAEVARREIVGSH